MFLTGVSKVSVACICYKHYDFARRESSAADNYRRVAGDGCRVAGVLLLGCLVDNLEVHVCRAAELVHDDLALELDQRNHRAIKLHRALARLIAHGVLYSAHCAADALA